MAYKERCADKTPIDFSIYAKEGENPKKYQERAKVVQTLLARKYTRSQIRVLHPLIMQDYSVAAITELFPIDTGCEDIKNFISVISN